MDAKQYKELIKLLTQIKNPELMDKFLEDLLTPKELEELVTRWQIVKQLSQGVTQREISKDLKVSIAKITRGSRELRDKQGGFWKILNKK